MVGLLHLSQWTKARENLSENVKLKILWLQSSESLTTNQSVPKYSFSNGLWREDEAKAWIKKYFKATSFVRILPLLDIRGPRNRRRPIIRLETRINRAMKER